MRYFRMPLIAALCILLGLAPAVSANSGPTWWEGATAAGLTVTGEDCPILVEHETLIFDIPEFPLEYYEDEGAFTDYLAQVTARYIFRNPTDADVNVKLLFPFGTAPQYAPTGRMLSWRYGVSMNGEPVETVLRHSLSWGEFDMAEDSARLREDYAAHPFYTPELPVTKFVYQPAGVDWEDNDTVRARVLLDGDPEKTKYMLDPVNSYETVQDHALVGSALGQGDAVTVYVLGEVPEELPEWTLSRGDVPISGTMELTSMEQMTLEELVLRQWDAGWGVSEIDWYNAAIDRMSHREYTYEGFLEWTYLDSLYLSLMGWYEYELTIPAGETLVNTVTAPVYPDIHSGWDPAIYTYEYLLSPAKGWADFGTLEIVVNTPYYMTQCNLDGFRENENGYWLELDGLPDRELTFVLSESADPGRPGSLPKAVCVLLAGVGVLLLLIPGLLLFRRRR